MSQTTTMPRPYYYALPYRYRRMSGEYVVIRGLFSIYEVVNNKTTMIVEKLSNRGDRLNELLKRGIPMDDALRLFYEMDDPS